MASETLKMVSQKEEKKVGSSRETEYNKNRATKAKVIMVPKIKESAKEELVIPERIAVAEDKRTGARSIFLPFDFPDGRHGSVVVIRLENAKWNPIQDLKSITLNFQ